MNQDDIVRMAREAGVSESELFPGEQAIERFAELVADTERKHCYDLIDTLIKAEREMCARMAEECVNIERLADDIRARGE